MGCSVALQHMARGGRHVARLVLINGPIKLARTEDDSFPWSMTEDVLEAYFSDMEEHWPSRERQFISDSLYRPGTDLVNVIFAITQQAPLDGLLKIVRAQTKLDFRDLLPQIEVPVLALYGRHDTYYPVELGAWIAGQCPRGEAVVFEESAHYPFIEEKERFAQVLSEFASREPEAAMACAVRRAIAITVSIGLTPGAVGRADASPIQSPRRRAAPVSVGHGTRWVGAHAAGAHLVGRVGGALVRRPLEPRDVGPEVVAPAPRVVVPVERQDLLGAACVVHTGELDVQPGGQLPVDRIVELPANDGLAAGSQQHTA